MLNESQCRVGRNQNIQRRQMCLQRLWPITSIFQTLMGRVPAPQCALSKGFHGQINLQCALHYFPVLDICNHASILKALFRF